MTSARPLTKEDILYVHDYELKGTPEEVHPAVLAKVIELKDVDGMLLWLEQETKKRRNNIEEYRKEQNCLQALGQRQAYDIVLRLLGEAKTK